jgi:hypothetical protein
MTFSMVFIQKLWLYKIELFTRNPWKFSLCFVCGKIGIFPFPRHFLNEAVSSTDFFSHFIANSVDEQFSNIGGKLFLEKNINEINVTLFNNFRINVVIIRKDR